jgi:hypothetical protein
MVRCRARSTQAAWVLGTATRPTCTAASTPICPAPSASATCGSFSSRNASARRASSDDRDKPSHRAVRRVEVTRPAAARRGRRSS